MLKETPGNDVLTSVCYAAWFLSCFSGFPTLEPLRQCRQVDALLKGLPSATLPDGVRLSILTYTEVLRSAAIITMHAAHDWNFTLNLVIQSCCLTTAMMSTLFAIVFGTSFWAACTRGAMTVAGSGRYGVWLTWWMRRRARVQTMSSADIPWHHSC